MIRSNQNKDQLSLRARWVYDTLRILRIQKRIFQKLINDPQRGSEAIAPKNFDRRLIKEERHIDGFQLLTIQDHEASDKHILFLHGGAYVAQAFSGHRYLMQKLAKDHLFKISFLDYPLAPEHDALTTHEILKKAYGSLKEAYKNDTFYFLGDSAGGGLALSFIQKLRDENKLPQISKTVLLSPWLDLSLSNPDILNYMEKDVILHLESLKSCGQLYAKKTDIKDPSVSPIYGSLNDLQKIKVFVSDAELMYPDCLLLHDKLESATGSSSDLVIVHQMIHDWVILPIRERDETIEEIASFFVVE